MVAQGALTPVGSQGRRGVEVAANRPRVLDSRAMPSEPRPRLALPSVVRLLRWILFAVLLAAAVVALVGVPRALQAGWPSGLRFVPVALLAVFVAGYAVYRFTLVKVGHYDSGKALVRVGLMLLVLGVIAGLSLERPPARPAAGVGLLGPLTGSDAVARALALEVARSRPREQVLPLLPQLVTLAEDPAPEVRSEASRTLAAITGEDAGEGEGAAQRWRAVCLRRGLLRSAAP